ncbi:hypothetical protein [Ruegeria sp. Alg231-54]|uniref:hypothetical protein n=1 Tax=Ruegeria sp. Alg231-54 TaxID=1922221 RepID=UPI000D561650|nr:hypothetical protein [Ruegeria sp. Alg231-54]
MSLGQIEVMVPHLSESRCSIDPHASAPEGLAVSIGLTASNPLPVKILAARVSSLMNISGQSGRPRSARAGHFASTGNFPCACSAFRAEQITC